MESIAPHISQDSMLSWDFWEVQTSKTDQEYQNQRIQKDFDDDA